MRPPLTYAPDGDRLVRFAGGGGMLVAGAELDRLGVMPGHGVIVRGEPRIVARIILVLAP